MSKREEKVKLIRSHVKAYPDFPRVGVLFRDIFSVLGNPAASTALYEVLLEDVAQFAGKVSAVCGLDSRGFLFGPQVAQKLNVPFVPVRKKGKLPGNIISKEFTLEYGTDVIEIQKDSLKGGNILLVDDLLATGGTLKAAGALVESANCKVVHCVVIMELEGLKGREFIPYPVHSILRF